MYGVIEGTGLMYETSKPMLPRVTSITVFIATSIITTFLNGNENLIRIEGSVIFGKDRAGNLNLFIRTIHGHTELCVSFIYSMQLYQMIYLRCSTGL